MILSEPHPLLWTEQGSEDVRHPDVDVALLPHQAAVPHCAQSRPAYQPPEYAERFTKLH